MSAPLALASSHAVLPVILRRVLPIAGGLFLLVPFLHAVAEWLSISFAMPILWYLLCCVLSVVTLGARLLIEVDDESDPLMTRITIGFSIFVLVVCGFLAFSGELETSLIRPPALTAALLVFLRYVGCQGLALLTPQTQAPHLLHNDLFLPAGLAIAVALAGGFGLHYLWSPQASILAACAAIVVLWPHLPETIGHLTSEFQDRLARRFGMHLAHPDAALEAATTNAVVFDRSALLADEEFVVTDVHAFDNRSDVLVAVAASAEALAEHPIASAIRALANDWEVPIERPDEYEEADGLGIVAMIGGEPVAVGNKQLMDQLNIDTFTANSLCRQLEGAGKTCVIVAVAQRAVGVLAVQATLHENAQPATSALRQRGRATVLVSGLSQSAAGWLAKSLNLESFRSGVPPRERANAAIGAIGTLSAMLVHRPSRSPEALLITALPRHQGDPLVPLAHVGVADPDSINRLISIGEQSFQRRKELVAIRWIAPAIFAILALAGFLPLPLAPFAAALAIAAQMLDPAPLSKRFRRKS